MPDIDKQWPSKEALPWIDIAALSIQKKFYELTSSKVPNTLKTVDIINLDTKWDELVANLRSGNDSTPVIKLDPYNLLTKLGEISTDREQRGDICPSVVYSM